MKLLLVDDERLELEALRTYIDWKKYGVTQIRTASDGRSAWQLVLDDEPDLVITDIQMPGMDGIALGKKIYAWDKNIMIVFLTGYDEFTYVREAMRVEAVDFLLKPFTEKTIDDMMKNVLARNEKEKLFASSVEAMEQQLLRRACSEEPSEGLMKDLGDLLNRRETAPKFGMVRFYRVREQGLARSIKDSMAEIAAAWQDKDIMTFLVEGHSSQGEAALRIASKIRELLESDYPGAYFTEVIGTADLHRASLRMDRLRNVLFYENGRPILGFASEPQSGEAEFSEHRTAQVHSAAKEAEAVLVPGKEQEFSEKLRILCTLMKKDHIGEARAVRQLGKLGMLMTDKFPVQIPGEGIAVSEGSEVLWSRLEACCTLTEMENVLLTYLQEYESSRQSSADSTQSYVVSQVKRYVEEHYAEQMSVEGMAERVHLSANYIRSVFKEGSGQTILEYITDYRLGRAEVLLRDQEIRVKDVGARVGYENASYFGTVFTKRFGMTPNEYRKKYQ